MKLLSTPYRPKTRSFFWTIARRLSLWLAIATAKIVILCPVPVARISAFFYLFKYVTARSITSQSTLTPPQCTHASLARATSCNVHTLAHQGHCCETVEEMDRTAATCWASARIGFSPHRFGDSVGSLDSVGFIKQVQKLLAKFVENFQGDTNPWVRFPHPDSDCLCFAVDLTHYAHLVGFLLQRVLERLVRSSYDSNGLGHRFVLL